MQLREAVVRMSLAALDTVYNRNVFDHENLLSKKRAKMLVLASPYLARYGARDLQALFDAAKADIPVISVPGALRATWACWPTARWPFPAFSRKNWMAVR